MRGSPTVSVHEAAEEEVADNEDEEGANQEDDIWGPGLSVTQDHGYADPDPAGVGPVQDRPHDHLKVSFDTVFSTHLPTARHIPKSARAEWARTLALTARGCHGPLGHWEVEEAGDDGQGHPAA